MFKISYLAGLEYLSPLADLKDFRCLKDLPYVTGPAKLTNLPTEHMLNNSKPASTKPAKWHRTFT